VHGRAQPDEGGEARDGVQAAIEKQERKKKSRTPKLNDEQQLNASDRAQKKKPEGKAEYSRSDTRHLRLSDEREGGGDRQRII